MVEFQLELDSESELDDRSAQDPNRPDDVLTFFVLFSISSFNCSFEPVIGRMFLGSGAYGVRTLWWMLARRIQTFIVVHVHVHFTVTLVARVHSYRSHSLLV